MKLILFLMILLSISSIETSVPDPASALELSVLSTSESPKIQTAFQALYQKAFYCAMGAAFGSAFFVSRLGWGLCLMSPWASTLGNECLILSQICGVAAQHAFTQMFKPSTWTKVPLSESSWHLNKALLSQISTSSEEEKKLLLFLEKRWLAKATGFFSSVIKWVCPCFGVTVQVHPETTSSYARSPSVGFSQTYKNRMEAWKESLPHPLHYPLILTRPSDVHEYLPSVHRVLDEEIETTVEKVALKLQTNEKVLVDLTALFPQESQKWISTWNDYQATFAKACKKHHLNLSHILCIQQLRQEEIGGIRLLPFATSSPEEVEQHDRFLVDWVSNFGISANRIELDRWPLPVKATANHPSVPIKLLSKEEFVSCLNSFEHQSSNVQKKLMVEATLRLLKGLMNSLKDDKWNQCPTRSSVAQISFSRIQEQFKFLMEEKENALFFDTASKIEQIHANLSSLLETLNPFAKEDFSPIYQNLLTSIPARLKPFASYGLHSSGMTSLAGIIKAVEKTLGKTPLVLFGENTYFECIFGAQKASHAVSIAEASEEDWREVDLILAQFNPVLKRIDLPPTEYKVEKIAEALHKALDGKKTLTLALDCTLDFINSPKVTELLSEFQEEIEKGSLNIVCYRSGLKFDLFGMDNYCGAPFYMLHNQDAKWSSFNSLLTDPVLQADRLSCQWFCLAYKYTAPELELYRKQIFDNTRALLDKLPPRIFTQVDYRIVPVEPGANAAFLDIKVSGPLHQIRSSALVGGSLYMCCMEKGHPIFYRPSLGFYHTNFTMIFGEESSTIRLTLGLDPTQVDVLAGCFEAVDALNGAPWQPLLDKLQANLSPQISF